jgi:hypothetical protein
VDYEIFEVCEVKAPRHFLDFHVVSIANDFNIGTTKFAAVIQKSQKSGFFLSAWIRTDQNPSFQLTYLIITINVPLFKKLRDIIFFWWDNHFFFFFFFFFKGLVAGCHSFCLLFIFYNIHTYIHSITFIQYIYPSPFAEASLHFFIACLLSGKDLPVVPSRESNSGLPYSKPTRYQLSNAAPYAITL